MPKFQFAFGQSKGQSLDGATAAGAGKQATAVEVVNGANGQPRQIHVISGSPTANNQGKGV